MFAVVCERKRVVKITTRLSAKKGTWFNFYLGKINDYRNNWSKKDKDEAARCLTILLNSRKYKITVFAMMQDANVEAISISKKAKD